MLEPSYTIRAGPLGFAFAGQPKAAVPTWSLIHRPNIFRERQEEPATAGCDGARQGPATQDFHWGIVREGELVVGRAQSFRVGLQFFVSADELDRVDFRSRPATQQNEEVRIARLPGFAEIDGAQPFQLTFIVSDSGIGLGVAAG